MICADCPRGCAVDREKGERGFCGGGYYASVAKIVDPFAYEEPCLGNVTAVFFGGCSLKCSYCQNIDISGNIAGCKEYGDAELARLMSDASGGIDLVTPTHCLSAIERAVALCKRPLRIIYNTSGYETSDAVRRARQFSNVFLTDFKYADNGLAAEFSGVTDYFARASEAVLRMRETKDEWSVENGHSVMTRGLIVRHLVLPGCVENSKAVLDFIAHSLGTDTVISLMSQFTPNGVGAPYGKLKKIEYKIVCEHALKLGFRNGYFQGFDSANGSFTPDFATED